MSWMGPAIIACGISVIYFWHRGNRFKEKYEGTVRYFHGYAEKVKLDYISTKFNDEDVNVGIVSMNKGETWYCFDPKSGEILGDVDKLYPGIVERQKAHSALAKYISENGSIDMNDAEGMELIREAGFMVQGQNA